MDKNKRKTVEGWIDKASAQLHIAQSHMNAPNRASDSIQASQMCVELAVKSILCLLGIGYPLAHGWGRKELAEIAKGIQARDYIARLAAQNLQHYVRLPRLLFLANFWSQFYLEAKYGIEAELLAPAQDLFDAQDAAFAVTHAGECLQAARQLLHLPGDRFAILTAP